MSQLDLDSPGKISAAAIGCLEAIISRWDSGPAGVAPIDFGSGGALGCSLTAGKGLAAAGPLLIAVRKEARLVGKASAVGRFATEFEPVESGVAPSLRSDLPLKWVERTIAANLSACARIWTEGSKPSVPSSSGWPRSESPCSCLRRRAVFGSRLASAPIPLPTTVLH